MNVDVEMGMVTRGWGWERGYFIWEVYEGVVVGKIRNACMGTLRYITIICSDVGGESGRERQYPASEDSAI